LDNIWNDLKFALRQLRRSPALAITAILTLALGIGANTAIFSLLDQALLRSLPVRDPKSLVVLEGTGKAWEGHFSSHGGDSEAYFSYPMYKDLRDRNQVFDGLITTGPSPVSITHGNTSQLTDSELVSGNYFTVLGVKPAMGRLFTQSEDLEKDADPVAVLSFDFWRNHLGSDPSVIGSTINVNHHPFQVIGVSAPKFRSAVWGQMPGVFIPMSMLGEVIPNSDIRLTDHKERWVNIIGRLKPGVSRDQAEAAMNPLWHALRAAELTALGTRSKRFTDDFLTNSRMHLLPGARGFSYDRENVQTPLLAIMGMALLVLLIASVNVASLLLVRSASRTREFSLRYALGAGAGRIVQQLLLEGLLIGLSGGLAGMAFAPIALRVLVGRITTSDGSTDFTSAFDPRLLLFDFAVSLTVSVLFSLAPVLQVRKPDLAAAMGQRTGTGTGGMLSFRRAVVALQIGLSVILLIAAGLFVRTMQKLQTADVGFNTTHLVTFGINAHLAGYAPAAIPALNQRVLDTLAALPGVQSVAATDDPELAGDNQYSNISVANYVPPPDSDFQVEAPYISPGYFATMQIPLIAGRGFTEQDDLAHPNVAVVNQSFVKHFCQTVQACLGRMIGSGTGNGVKLNTQIVGVVRDTRHESVRAELAAAMFRPLKQTDNTTPSFTFYYVRSYTDPNQEIATIRRTMQQLDPSLALGSLLTMEGQIADTLIAERVVTFLAIAFGILASLLAGVGLYGVLAYSTAQRTREIGIRMALGSTRVAISRIVLSDVLRLAGIGILVALPVAFGLSHILRSQLFGVSPSDPLSILFAVLLISAVAFIAALIPAVRAASINPTEALRTE
jgi:putative ABC transport system permease protein